MMTTTQPASATLYIDRPHQGELAVTLTGDVQDGEVTFYSASVDGYGDVDLTDREAAQAREALIESLEVAS